MKNTTPVQSAALFICRLWFFLSWSSFIFYMFIVFFFCECVYMCLFWISPSSVMQYDGLWRNPHNAAMLLAIYLCQFGLDVFCYWRGVAYYLTDPFDPYPWDSSRFTKIRVFVIVQNIYVYVCVRALWCLRLPFKIYIFLPVSLLLIVFFHFACLQLPSTVFCDWTHAHCESNLPSIRILVPLKRGGGGRPFLPSHKFLFLHFVFFQWTHC